MTSPRPSLSSVQVPSAPAAGLPRVGIAGATGFAGRELVRILAGHPGVRLETAMSSGTSGSPRALPGFARIWDGEVVPFSADALAATDIALLALPDAAAAGLVPGLIGAGVRVIDLSGTFRLHDVEARRRWYPDGASYAGASVYGLTEHHREAIRTARLVANPGCYPTAALVALQPLAAAGLLDGDVAVDAKSGISGAGRTPTERTHFSECHGNVAAYGVFEHRHTPEIEQALGRTVTFVPHLVPLDRGLLATSYARVRPGTTAGDIAAAFEAAYAGAPFVRVTGEALPEIKHVAHTNFCDVGWRFDAATGRLVLVSCLDNLVKGAAGQAVQNLNVMLDLDERTGLRP